MRRPAAPALALLLALGARAARAQTPATPSGPTLLTVVTGSDGTRLTVDSASVARAGDSTFVLNVRTLFAPSPQPRAADHEEESGVLDCGGGRMRGWGSSVFAGELYVGSDTASGTREWKAFDDSTGVLYRAICTFLLGSFAARLPVTDEAGAAEVEPELRNARDIQMRLSRGYPRRFLNSNVSGSVLARLRIGKDGRVDPESIRVLWATRPAFADAARPILAAMRFTPARRQGRPAAVWATLPVSFSVTRD